MLLITFTQLSLFVVLSLSGWLSQTIPAAVAAPIRRPLTKRDSFSPPYFVVYNDIGAPGEIGPPKASSVEGFNVVVLSFLLGQGGAVDKAKEWQSMSDNQRSAVKADYAAAGIKLIVSAFGATETPTTRGADPVQLGHSMSAWVQKYQLDGIDVDYEDLSAFNAADGRAEDWLISFTQTLRADLPQEDYILTHAPLAPWFAPTYKGGGYKKIHEAVGASIDFYAIQFYNQGPNEYMDCDSLLHESKAFPGTSVFEIAAAGIPLDKIVIGKPATASDASDGFMETGSLASCLEEAKAGGWNGGIMSWQYPHADSAWISAVKGSAFGDEGPLPSHAGATSAYPTVTTVSEASDPVGTYTAASKPTETGRYSEIGKTASTAVADDADETATTVAAAFPTAKPTDDGRLPVDSALNTAHSPSSVDLVKPVARWSSHRPYRNRQRVFWGGV